MATNYQRGADFERGVAKDLERWGFVTVRSAGSHKPADVVAMLDGQTIVIQCKRDGVLRPEEWNKFWEWAKVAGATPILASKGPRGSGIIYNRLTSRKVGRGRQPLAPWVPQRDGSYDEVP